MRSGRRTGEIITGFFDSYPFPPLVDSGVFKSASCVAAIAWLVVEAFAK